jgi:hypothetical protein
MQAAAKFAPLSGPYWRLAGAKVEALVQIDNRDSRYTEGSLAGDEDN